jgi:UDP-glucose 4-epimerase
VVNHLAQRTALVTGAYGFVGRHVARAIAARGCRVRGIGHGTWSRDEWRAWGITEWHTADIDVETLTTYAGEPNIVFHCAGSGTVGFSMTHPYQDYQRTVGTTLAVLEFMRLHQPEARLVVPSSAGVYGIAQTLPIGIGAPLNPVSPYGLHKKMAEDLCRSYGRHFGIRSALVRLFSVYGTGIRKQLLWDACSKISAGDLAFAGTGLETRDWLHVEDAADLMILSADHASGECPVVNGGAGIAVRIQEVVDAIAADLGCADRPQFSGRVRAGDPTHYQADIAEALRLGWAPKRHWRDEIRAYVDWYRRDAP